MSACFGCVSKMARSTCTAAASAASVPGAPGASRRASGSTLKQTSAPLFLYVFPQSFLAGGLRVMFPRSGCLAIPDIFPESFASRSAVFFVFLYCSLTCLATAFS